MMRKVPKIENQIGGRFAAGLAGPARDVVATGWVLAWGRLGLASGWVINCFLDSLKLQAGLNQFKNEAGAQSVRWPTQLTLADSRS